ncbi:MAG: hypothetical protein CMA72_06755 [Euryarchaeota archaeon]|nr:hypothetical protein [Euryarchaeota archaeon]|tara:strand:+ start:11752 stop:12090 length:339 start_codon:yes stop_codon:yes gene_type:complete
MKITKRQLRRIIKEAAMPGEMVKVTVSMDVPFGLFLDVDDRRPNPEMESLEDIEMNIEDALRDWLQQSLREFQGGNSAAFKGKQGVEQLSHVEIIETATYSAMDDIKVSVKR